MIPILDDAPRAHPPAIVIALVAVNVAVFLWMRLLPPQAQTAIVMGYALIPLRYSDPAAARAVGLDPNDWLPLLSNAFLHGGFLHILLNMWTLWVFGPAMEARFGRAGFLGLYLAGGIVASATHLALSWTSAVPALGASGAIAAVLGAYAVTYPRARVILLVPILIFPLFLPVSALFFALVWFLLQLVQGTEALLAPSLAPGIAFWAHVGGFVFGALVAALWHPPQRLATVSWQSAGRGLRRSPWQARR